MTAKKSILRKVEGRLILKSVSFLAVLIAATFICAGRIDYWQGWVFNGMNVVFLLLSYFILPSELIKERLKPEKGMKRWDKIYYAVSVPFFCAIFVVSVLDAGRFYWEPRVSVPVVIISIAVYTAGQTFILWAKKVNRFFSSVVRIQYDRSQTVCKDGPYRIVRHPGYFGGMVYTVVTPLVLGSFWGLIPAALTLVLVIIRTDLEDKTLHRELVGYADFASKTKYRLLPGIW